MRAEPRAPPPVAAASGARAPRHQQQGVVHGALEAVPRRLDAVRLLSRLSGAAVLAAVMSTVVILVGAVPEADPS